MQGLVGLALLGIAAFIGRRPRRHQELGETPTFVRQIVGEINQFAIQQYPRATGEIIAIMDPEIDDPLVTSPLLRMQCKTVKPILERAGELKDEAEDAHDQGAASAKVLVQQAWAAASQLNPDNTDEDCPKLGIPNWVLN